MPLPTEWENNRVTWLACCEDSAWWQPWVLWSVYTACAVIVHLRPVTRSAHLPFWKPDYRTCLLGLLWISTCSKQSSNCVAVHTRPFIAEVAFSFAVSGLLLSPLSHWLVPTSSFMWPELRPRSFLCLIEPHTRNESFALKPLARPLLYEALLDLLGWVRSHWSLSPVIICCPMGVIVLDSSDFSHLSYPIYIMHTVKICSRCEYGNYFTYTSYLQKPALLPSLVV